MNQLAAKWIVPFYVFLCLVVGGSNRGIWGSAVLQVGAALLIGFAAVFAKPRDLPRSARLLLILVIASLLLAVLQLAPLSPEIWTQLPGRAPIKEGYEALGASLPWLPLSLTPYETLQAAFFALPFLAVLVAIVLVPQVELRWVVGALVIGTLANIALGALQSTGGDHWKIYSITNTGAVGFFANRNFLGTLLVVNIPFAVALMGWGRPGKKSEGVTFKVAGAAYLLVILIGIVLNRSLAAALIAVPVSLASLALLPLRLNWKWYAAGMAAAVAVAAALLLTNSPVQSQIMSGDEVSIQTRMVIWSQTLRIVSDTFPFGTGLGSFQDIYAFYEDPALVRRFYVNNAHNDYLELFLETGLPGALLICGFFVWWAAGVRRVWRSSNADLIAKAATIASAAILAHSIVDYPLRTAAISSIFAFCLAAMATFGSSARSVHPGERGTRHVRIA
jgi:O-antigen ligase